MVLRTKLLILIVCFLHFGCKKNNELDRSELLHWVESEENLLTRKHKEKDIDYIATYCPVSYMIAKEFKANNIEESTFKQRSKDLEGFEYFKLRIQRNNSKEEVLLYNISNQQEYTDRIDYLSYGFEENVILVRNNFQDTLFPALFHFERTYGIVPYIDFVFSFKKDTACKDQRMQLVINDNVFGKGIFSYDFNRADLNNAPKFKLN